MDALSLHDVRALGEHASPTSVSLYMSTHPSGPTSQEDTIRLRNLIDQAEEKLVEQGTRPVEARELLRPARDLPLDELFWRDRSAGLAVFLSPGFFRAYRLIDPVDESVAVGHRFLLRPLIASCAENGRFFLLSLSQNKVAFYQGNRFHLDSVTLADLPKSLEHWLNVETMDRGMQVHSGARLGGGKESAVFHGQGGVRETAKQEQLAYVRAVAAALKTPLQDERVPLVVAAVDELASMFLEKLAYPHVLAKWIHGNPDDLTQHELHVKAWDLVATVIEEKRHAAVARYRELAGSQRVEDQVSRVLIDAMQGRVDTLFIDRKAHCWGRFDAAHQSVLLHDTAQFGDDDLIDLAARETLAQRGQVVTLGNETMPSRSPMSALLRF